LGSASLLFCMECPDKGRDKGHTGYSMDTETRNMTTEPSCCASFK
jgi:hypothetical protein